MDKTYKVIVDLYNPLNALRDREIEEEISSFVTRVRNEQLPLEWVISQELVALHLLKSLSKEDTEVRRSITFSMRSEEGHISPVTKEQLKERLPGLVKEVLEV